jgi:cytochrome P450
MSIVEFDLNPAQVASRDAYEAYAAMRGEGRVLRTPYGPLLAHRYNDVREIQTDHDTYSMAAIDPNSMAGSMGAEAEAVDTDNPLMVPMMISSDPPDHERLRRVVSRAFTPRSINALEPHIRDITRGLLAPLAKGEPFDFVADFAGPLPTIVIAELLGVPSEDSARFRRWSDLVMGTDVEADGGVEVAREAQVELYHYLAGQVALRKEDPTDDLIGRMVVANEEQVMSDAEVVAACVLLLIAGNETTMRLLTNMALWLNRCPEQRQRLLDDSELIPSGIEETLRYDSPVQMVFRGVKQDTVLGDVELSTGDMVLTMIGAANRDPEGFADPDTYDVGRTDNMHVAFGHGIHYCLGAPLARREARLAFEEILELAPQFQVLNDDENLAYPTGGFLRSPKSLIVKR